MSWMHSVAKACRTEGEDQTSWLPAQGVYRISMWPTRDMNIRAGPRICFRIVSIGSQNNFNQGDMDNNAFPPIVSSRFR